MSDINWNGNAACYFDGEQWFANESESLSNWCGDGHEYESAFEFDDFQLNEIVTGDFISSSELDTERKYNDAVEVFGLFGVTGGLVEDKYSYQDIVGMFSDDKFIAIHNVENEVCAGFVNDGSFCNRKMFFDQIIAIGKLKRMMLERENLAPKTATDLTADNSDQVKSPKHYQLIEGVESIEIIARSMTKEQWKGFCLGNMLKYRIRAGKKDALQQDIEKANFYGELYEMHKEKCYD